MTWDSIESLLSEFGIPANPTDFETIRSELRRQMAEFHPDKTGGSFRSATDEAKYHRLSEAIEFLDGKLPGRLVLRGIQHQLATLEKSIQELPRVPPSRLEPPPPRHSVDQLRKENLGSFVTSKISSGTLGAVCAGILTFSSLLKDNPVFGRIADNRLLTFVLAVGFLASGTVFAISWFRERRSSTRIQWLLSDSGLASNVGSCIHHGTPTQDLHDEPEVTKRALANQILLGNHAWGRNRVTRWWRSLLAPRISAPVAEKIAATHINELLSRGVITARGLRGIEPTYLMEKRLSEELQNDQYEYPWRDPS